MSKYYVGVDIGGTFTDCVMVTDSGEISTAKTLSTHATSPAVGVMNGVELLAGNRGLSVEAFLARTERFSHGTTIGTNLVVERKGAAVGVVATKGHSDTLMMMRAQGRTAGVTADRVFDAHHETMPAPLVPRHRIVEVEERIAADGTVLASLNEPLARESFRALLATGEIEAMSVSLLWSIVNPVHELRMREIIHEIAPDMFVSLSSEVSPRQGEFERTVAAVVNSYVGPASRRYLDELARELRARGLRTPLYIMQASGGVVPVAEVSRRPLQTIGSGPAGGLAGTVSVARSLRQPNVIATDMGGTSFEVGLIVDGQPTMATQEILDKYTFHSTHLDLRSIACGGGSIAHVDRESGALRVGPQSAGSNPGPACYGTGKIATVTDADVVLGLLDAETFLGGRMRLNRNAAERAIQSIADKVGLSLDETAAGIIQVNAHAAATLIRQRTLEQGIDPRDFTVYAFGGAGPVHAFAYAKELDVKHVVVPLGNGASTLSAYGAAVSDLIRSFERSVSLESPFDPVKLAAVVQDLEDKAYEAMRDAGVTGQAIEIERVVSMRYVAQQFQELSVRMPEGPIDSALCAEMERRFTAQYARLYSEAALALFQAIEMFGARVTARVRMLSSSAGEPTAAGASAPLVEAQTERSVYWPGANRRIATKVYTNPLTAGDVVHGPAIVELPHTSVAVAPGQRLLADRQGSLTLFLN